ncbi:MAG: autotransporter-associated beta strand repeat-containing protein [Chthoniobacter sp.]
MARPARSTSPPVTINADTVIANITPTLSVSALISSSSNGGTTGIDKIGNGILGLSGANTFGGGVNIEHGGIQIGASTNVTTVTGGIADVFASGPLGTGDFTVGAGTSLSSSGAFTVNNDYILGANDLNFKGTNNLTLNGATTLNAGETVVTVDAPQMTATLGGVISGIGASLRKEGLGVLSLTNNNLFDGNITLNAGTLILAGLNGASPSPFSGNVTINNGGLLSFQNNGTGSSGLITYSNGVILNSALSAANIFVGNLTANTGNTIELPSVTIAGGQILDVSSANSYQLRIDNIQDGVSGVPFINPGLGTTVLILTWTGDKPAKLPGAQGSVIFPDIIAINQSNILTTGTGALNGNGNGQQSINLSDTTAYPGGYYPLVVQKASPTPATTPAGFVSGGLNASFSSLGAAQSSLATSVAGIGFSGSGITVANINDGSDANRPRGHHWRFRQ